LAGICRIVFCGTRMTWPLIWIQPAADLHPAGIGGFVCETLSLRVQTESTEANWMNPVISKGATPPCEAGIVAGVGGVSGFCAQTLAAINNKAVAIILFPEVCNLNNI
jgi:hypothetical protein